MTTKEDRIKFIRMSIGYTLGDLLLVLLLISVPSIRTEKIILLVVCCIAYSIYVISDLFHFYRGIDSNFMKFIK